MHDLLKAKNIGLAVYTSFCEKRLASNEEGFYEPLKKRRLKTFSEMLVKKTYKAGDKQVILKADRNLFAKMILIGQTRKLDMRDVLSHRLGAIPWALATPAGTLRKTARCVLAKKLRKDQSPVESIADNSACIIDRMALVKSVEGNNMTFGDVSNTILNKALKEAHYSTRMDIVFDVYQQISIKNTDRVARGSQASISFSQIAREHRIKQWRNFLCNSQNKTRLIEFLVSDWSSESQRKKLNGKDIYVTISEICKHLTEEIVCELGDLKCTHEEADTRMILHAVHYSTTGSSAVVFVSEDTDVFVLCVSFSSQVPCPLYVKCGSKTRTQYFDVIRRPNGRLHHHVYCSRQYTY